MVCARHATSQEIAHDRESAARRGRAALAAVDAAPEATDECCVPADSAAASPIEYTRRGGCATAGSRCASTSSSAPCPPPPSNESGEEEYALVISIHMSDSADPGAAARGGVRRGSGRGHAASVSARVGARARNQYMSAACRRHSPKFTEAAAAASTAAPRGGPSRRRLQVDPVGVALPPAGWHGTRGGVAPNAASSLAAARSRRAIAASRAAGSVPARPRLHSVAQT